MNGIWHGTKTNFLMGLRLACFSSSVDGRFTVNAHQLLMLFMLDLAQNVVFGRVVALPVPVFDWYALPMYGFDQGVFFLVLLLAEKLWKKTGFFLTAGVITLSVSPVLNALIYLDQYLRLNADTEDSNYAIWGLLIALYSLLILWRVFYTAAGRVKSLAWVVFIATVLVAALQFYYFGDAQKFWKPA